MEYKTERFFNTAGPIIPEDQYHIDPLSRVNMRSIMSLIAQKKYFIFHAPRQTGKTTLLRALMTYLNNEGKYTCLHINVEKAQPARENVKAAMRAIVNTLAEQALDFLDDAFLKERWQDIIEESGEYAALENALKLWSKNNKRPIVLFIDEIDSLVGDTLISVLRQVRSGYEKRPALFPNSIILCGIRDLKDYRIYSSKEKDIITGGSAFNIKSESLRLGDFRPDEVKQLFLQHSSETGQRFEDDVFPIVWELTKGQPWLVNALAYETCFKMEEGMDRKTVITAAMIRTAAENLIVRRETHLDQLTDKLKEERVSRVIGPILACSDDIGRISVDDIEYVADLGLVRRIPELTIANRIYKEVIPRQLTYTTQIKITHQTEWYVQPDGLLDMNKLLTAFQEFFRKHFESWVDGFDYEEAGAQLLIQAFLQRIVNGGGRVEREYGLGRTRTDLLILWPHKNGTQQVVLELKLRYGSLDTVIKKGLKQTHGYMDKCGTSEGYLLIFDIDSKLTWEEKIFKKNKTFKGTAIPVYGM
ncbi:MAG: ATP-binding protein [bacterium]|nr:ATP-binding protein [bacterium]